MTDWRITATIERLISNIPAACKVLEEEGYISLAGQLGRDCDNLIYWQEQAVNLYPDLESMSLTKEVGWIGNE